MRQALNIVGWFGTALVVIALILRLSGEESLLGANGDRYVIYLALVGLVCVLLYPIVNWREVVDHFKRRQGKYAAVTTTSIIVVLGILIAVNYLSYRRNKRWDLTANSVNSLSEQSLKVLADLKEPMKLVVIDQGQKLEQHRPRMSMYDNASNQVSVEYLDGERDPIRAKQYGIDVLPTIIIEYMGRMEKVSTLDEREITSAIIRAVTGSQRKMYFVQGHGERDPKAEQDGSGYGYIGRLLQADNVAVETLVLTQHKDVPDDATIVALVGPTADPLDEEIEQLKRYLAKGGKLLLMLDPAIGERAQPLAKLTALAHDWGIDVGNDVILDVSGRSPNPTFAIASPPYPSHPVTQSFRLNTAFIVARSVTPAMPAPAGKTVQPLVQTAEAAWAETDLVGLQKPGAQPEMNAESGDKAGPVGIAASATAPVAAPPEPPKKEGDTTEKPEPPQTRLVVFGDSDFASNSVANSLGNTDLFLNAVNWLTSQENLIAIRPREPRDARLTVTPQQINRMRFFSIFILPVAIVALGIFTWARRRRA